jgi:hypothetical protein
VVIKLPIVWHVSACTPLKVTRLHGEYANIGKIRRGRTISAQNSTPETVTWLKIVGPRLKLAPQSKRTKSVYCFITNSKGLRAGCLRFDSRQRQEIYSYFCCVSSRPAPVSIQFSSQWLQRALSPGVKRPNFEGDHSPPSSAKFKNK